MYDMRELKYLLGWLIAGTRGGVTRAKMIQALNETPQNANQLATLLKMDYRTMRHHLEVLQKNGIITSAGSGYGTTYFLSPQMEKNYILFEEILDKIWKKKKGRRTEGTSHEQRLQILHNFGNTGTSGFAHNLFGYLTGTWSPSI